MHFIRTEPIERHVDLGIERLARKQDRRLKRDTVDDAGRDIEVSRREQGVREPYGSTEECRARHYVERRGDVAIVVVRVPAEIKHRGSPSAY